MRHTGGEKSFNSLQQKMLQGVFVWGKIKA
jgi:hypothetical protein